MRHKGCTDLRLLFEVTSPRPFAVIFLLFFRYCYPEGPESFKGYQRKLFPSKNPHKKKSNGVRSQDLGGHLMFL